MLRKIVLWLLATIALAGAQNFGTAASDGEVSIAVPPRPAGLVLDDSRIFAQQPERLKAISDRLERLRREYGFSLYLVIHSSLIDVPLGDYVRQLQAGWVGEESGWVVVAVTDSGQLAFGNPIAKTVEIEEGGALPNDSPTDVVSYERNRILQDVAQQLSPYTDRSERIEQMVNRLSDEISKLLESRRQNPRGEGRVRTVVLGIGLLAVCALVTLLGLLLRRRSQGRPRGQLRFPRVHVATRLGAPYGGGRISSRSFGGSPPR